MSADQLAEFQPRELMNLVVMVSTTAAAAASRVRDTPFLRCRFGQEEWFCDDVKTFTDS